jgi:NNP family nitrate/nitrite transporter-like MFS transporter
MVQGLMLITFSTTTSIIVGVIFLISFSLSVQMAEGATFSVVPFINKKAIGSVSGIVGAGGNVGAFLAAMLLKSKSAVAEKAAIVANEGLGDEIIKTAQSVASSSAVSSGYLLIGFVVVVTGIVALSIKFSTEEEKEEAPESLNGLTPELIPIKVKR